METVAVRFSGVKPAGVSFLGGWSRVPHNPFLGGLFKFNLNFDVLK